MRRGSFALPALIALVLAASGCQRGKKPPAVKDITQIAAGSGHACALFRDGALRCWGDDTQGQSAPSDQKVVLRPQTLTPRGRVVTIFAGSKLTCALLQGSAPQCWGELSKRTWAALPDQAQKNLPFDLSDSPDITAFAIGDSHACALTATGNVECFGAGSMLGIDHSDDATKPLKIPGLMNVTQIAAGNSHTCALIEDGTVRCWGINSKGQLGTINSNTDSVPTQVKLNSRAIGIFAGGLHTCALLYDRTLSCWGDNSHGQLGNPAVGPYPRAVSTLTSVAKVALGQTHSCAILSDGTVFCWGDNAEAELADGTRIERSEPVRVSGQYEVKDLIAGNGFTCLRTEEVTRCWGSDASAAVGDWRVSSEPVTVPVEVRF